MPSVLRATLILALVASPTAATAQAADLLPRMTLEEKFWQLFMVPGDLTDSTHDYRHGIFGLQIPAAPTAREDAERIDSVQRFFVEHTRLGIPIVPFDEAVHGLTRPGATVFPQAIGLAATWDTALMSRVATAIAREARSRGIRQVLSPVVNLATDVRWGRTEETYGEDPLLASAMARAFVAPFERLGVITTPKHFVANVGEGGRDSYPISLDGRTLAELYFPPFRAAFAAGSRSVMTAYNSVGGLPATQNPQLLTETLRRAWGFQGFVITDAAATGGATVLHHTASTTQEAARQAFMAGVDVIFQSAWPQYAPYLDAVRTLVPPTVTDSAVAHVLRAKTAIGLFTDPYGNPDSAAWWNDHPTHRALARETAAAAMVLLRNTGTLPLDANVPSVALIGADAAEPRLGGYTVPGAAAVSILAGLTARLGSRVHYAPGPGRESAACATVPTGRVALTAEFFANPDLAGRPTAVRHDSAVDVRWSFAPPAPGLGTDWYSVRWSGTLTAGPERVTRLGMDGTDGWRLWLDDRLLLDAWDKRSAGTQLAQVALAPGSRHTLRLEFHETTGNAQFRLVWDTGSEQAALARLDSAVALARRSAVAVVVAGIEEGEFRDRARLGLPGYQEELVRRVAATGTPTVVLLVGGSAITMPWLDSVGAVLMAWYPGEEGGHAVADILFGEVSPSGRLPISFPIEEGQLPLTYNHRPTGRGDDYADLSGRPLFPFGFGLSYTRFTYDSLVIVPSAIAPQGSAEVRLMVRNAGARAGHEVVQLYLRDEVATYARPVLQLAGFTRVWLRPGEAREVRFTLGPEQLAVLDATLHPAVEPGMFTIYVGASSRDIRLRGTLEVR